jgi:EAL domain-containing protein (putative c-di-GMP-specific phosphodiesterase class I)
MACDVVQGFLFSKPVPAEEIPRLITQRLSERGSPAAATPHG